MEGMFPWSSVSSLCALVSVLTPTWRRLQLVSMMISLHFYLCVGEIDYKETEIDMGGLRSPDLALSMFCVFLQKVRLGLLTSCLDSSVGVRWIRLM